jgi:DNA repair photolyase
MKKINSDFNKASFVYSRYDNCIGKYELDLITGCPVKCVYCDLRDDSLKKLNISNILDGNFPLDIASKGVYLSPNSDPFSKPVIDLTQSILEYFLPKGVPFLIITKNIIPQKTIDLLAKYPAQIYAQISIARIDDKLSSYIEPGAARTGERLKNITKLNEIGVNVTAILMPLFPEVDDTTEALNSIVQACAKAGSKYLKAAYAVIHPKDLLVKDKLKNHPDFSKSLNVMTEYIKIHIGGGLTVIENRRVRLYSTLTDLCRNYDIKFQSCPILDPAVLNNSSVSICRTYVKHNT